MLTLSIYIYVQVCTVVVCVYITVVVCVYITVVVCAGADLGYKLGGAI